MKQLVGPYKLNEALLKQMWFNRLPRSVRQILNALMKSPPLDDLAEMADKVTEVCHDNHYINTMQPYGAADVGYLNCIQRQLSQLMNQLASLQTTVATVQARQLGPSFRRRSSSRRRSRSPKKSSDVCWYHSKYGAKARRCTRPCAFSSTDTMNQGNSSARQ
ncbi:unnamed protein product [Schistosoma rodhaini]|nr:unnamed protein product [Schistosoma rodhaini]